MGVGRVAGKAGAKAWRARQRAIARLVSVGLAGAAVIVELRKPKDERAWNGKLLGFVPYDLRRPTPSRVKRSLWAPDDDRFLVPRAFGVGWSVNLNRVLRAVKERKAR